MTYIHIPVDFQNPTDEDFAKDKPTDLPLDGRSQALCCCGLLPFEICIKIIFYSRDGTCRQPYVKGLTLMANSIFDGWRMEDVWLDK